jgi:hypothetical protein
MIAAFPVGAYYRLAEGAVGRRGGDCDAHLEPARREGAGVPGLWCSRAARYGAAVVAVGLALLLQLLLGLRFGGDPNLSPFMIFFAAVMVASWFGGLGPGLLATSLSALLRPTG